MNDKELLKQALHALEILTDCYDDNSVGIEIDAIEALRDRLAQPEMFNGLTEEQTNATMSVMGLSQPESEQTRSQKLRDAGITRRPKGWDKDGDESEPVAWMEFERFMDEDGLMSERKVLYTWDPCRGVPLYTAIPQRERIVFPTMLRKMWSGGEVQAWLDENVNKEKNT